MPKPAIASTRVFRRNRFSLALLALAGISSTALAQEAATPAAAETASADGVVLEKVTVSATRRDARVQDVPLNITAITGKDIERQGLTDLASLTRAVPGLFLVDQGGRDGNRVIVRGLNVSALTSSEGVGNSTGGSVATYVGDIPLYLDLKLIDMERVEALLGPQGTLYGAGTLGGAIRYLPNRPSTKARTLSFSQDVYGLAHSQGIGSETSVVGNLPLSSKAAVRASLGFTRAPGFTDYNFLVKEPGVSDPEPDFGNPTAVSDNLERESDVDIENTLYGRIGLAYNFSDALAANLTYFYQNQDVGGRTVSQRDSFGTADYASAYRFKEPNERRNQLLSLELTWDVGFAALTSATGYSQYDEVGQRDQTDLLLDFDYGYEDFPSFVAFTRETQEQERLSQEIRLVSKGDGPWNWIVGGFYNEAKADATSSEFVPGYPEFRGIDRPDNLEFFQVNDQTFTEQAVFGELGYAFTPKWQATIGARVFKFEDDLSQGIAIPLVDGSGPNEIIPVLQQNKAGDSDTSFKFNTSYTFSSDLLTYLTVSEGYRNGGVNPLPTCPNPPPEKQFPCNNDPLYKPDSTTNYELGVHSAWLGGRLVVNGSIYYIDWKDVQVAGLSDFGMIPIIVNGARARSQGLDLAVNGKLSRHWSVSANYAYNSAELTEDSPTVVNGGGFSGDRLPGSPEHQGNLVVTYSDKLTNGWGLAADAGMRAVGNVFTRPGNRDNGEELGGYAVFKAAVRINNGPWSARLYADNLFNRYVETGVRRDPTFIRQSTDEDNSDGGNDFRLRNYHHDVLEPLRVGANFRYEFKLQ